MSYKEIADKKWKPLIDVYGNSDSLVKIFSLVKIEERGDEEEELGGIFFRLSNITFAEDDFINYKATSEYKFIIEEKFRNKEENFICSVNRGDIINIRSEYAESEVNYSSDTFFSFLLVNYLGIKRELPTKEAFSLHTATLTFLFKEMSFPTVF